MKPSSSGNEAFQGSCTLLGSEELSEGNPTTAAELTLRPVEEKSDQNLRILQHILSYYIAVQYAIICYWHILPATE